MRCLTETGGTTTSAAVVVLGDTEGRDYLTSFNTGKAFNDGLNGKPIQSVTLDLVRNTNYMELIASNRTDGFITCCAGGTMIDVPAGSCVVENLKNGDHLQTKDAGPQPILNISRSRRIWHDAGAVVRIMPNAW